MPRIGSLVVAAASGGGSIVISQHAIPENTTGVIATLSTSITGTLTYSKLSGSAKVTVASNGTVSLTTALVFPEVIDFIARVSNTDGDAVEKKITLTAVVAADITPDAFSFTDVIDALLNTSYISNAITVSGINSSSPVSVTGGQYRINGGAWVTASGTVEDGDTVEVRHTTSALNGEETNTVLTIGGVSDTFTTTTVYAALVVSGTPPEATIGVPYTFTFTVTGGKAPVTTTCPGLPSGLTYNGTTHTISGTPVEEAPAEPVTTNITVTATDARGTTATLETSITVNPSVIVTPTITGIESIPELTDGEAFSFDLTIASGTEPFTVDNIVKPSWMTLTLVDGNIIRCTGTASLTN